MVINIYNPSEQTILWNRFLRFITKNIKQFHDACAQRPLIYRLLTRDCKIQQNMMQNDTQIKLWQFGPFLHLTLQIKQKIANCSEEDNVCRNLGSNYWKIL